MNPSLSIVYILTPEFLMRLLLQNADIHVHIHQLIIINALKRCITIYAHFMLNIGKGPTRNDKLQTICIVYSTR